jgi:tetratricopeptide (TPR) repeat protein
MGLTLVAWFTCLLAIAAIGVEGWVRAFKSEAATREAKRKLTAVLCASDLFLAEQAIKGTNGVDASDLIRSIQTALDRQPANPALWKAYGVVLGRIGSHEEALASFAKAIELARAGKDKPTLKDSLFRRSALLRKENRFAEAGMDERNALGFPVDASLPPPDYSQALDVTVHFGATVRQLGLHPLFGGDSRAHADTRNGEDCHFFEAGWNYAYFYIDPTFKWNLGSNVVIRVEYQNLTQNPIGAHYDNGRNAFTEANGPIRLPNLGPWRVEEFRIQNAHFRNSLNGGSDFRIYDNEKGFYLKSVTIERNQSTNHGKVAL